VRGEQDGSEVVGRAWAWGSSRERVMERERRNPSLNEVFNSSGPVGAKRAERA